MQPLEALLSGRRVLLTGGAGFIGSQLCRVLAVDNDLLVYDDFRRDALTGTGLLERRNVVAVRGDVLDLPRLATQVRTFKPHVIIHLAAIAGIDSVIARPTETMIVNMVGTANALSAAKETDCLERFVDFSTSEVFGTTAFRADERQDTRIGAVGEARWTYAVSKLAGEHLTSAFHEEFALPTVSIRPFNIYGPGQVGEGAIKVFIDQALRGEDLVVHGDGNQIRAWCYVDDFMRGLMLALVRPEAVGESINIGNSRAVITILGLAQTVVRVLGSSSRIRFEKRGQVDIELRVPSVSKARDLLGFQAEVDLEEGILKTAHATLDGFGCIHAAERQADVARAAVAGADRAVVSASAVQALGGEQ